MGHCCVEDLGETRARLHPHDFAELDSIRDDEILEAVRARTCQLFVVLFDAPFQLGVEIVDEQLANRVVILSEHVDNCVESVITRSSHPFDFL